MFMCLSLTLGLPAGAQEKSLVTGPRDLQGKSAQGQLTVTATVVSSVGLVIGPNGERVLVVANAPAGKDSLTARSKIRDSAREEQSEEKKINSKDLNSPHASTAPI